jgi:hypothetical protein
MALAERTAYWQQTVMGLTPLTEPVAVVKLPVQVGDVPTLTLPDTTDLYVPPSMHKDAVE